MLTNSALQFSKHGRPAEVLQKVTHALNMPSSGKHLIRVRMLAAPVNHADLGAIGGGYPLRPELPNAVPGNEGVGIVEEVHPQCGSTISPGDYVIPAVHSMGTWQKYIWAEASKFIKLPLDKPSLEEIIETHGIAALATLNSNLGTACSFLNSFGTMSPGDVVCQTSANSFLGKVVIQMAKLKGLKTVNLVRDETGKEELYALGASLCLTYDECSPELVRERLGSLPKFALCTVGGPLFANLLSLMEEKSTIIVISAVNKAPLELAATAVIFKQITLRGFWMSKWYQQAWEDNFVNANDKLWKERIVMLESILRLYKENKIKLPQCKITPFDQLKESELGQSKSEKQVITFTH